MSFGLNGLVFLDDAGWVGDDAGWVWSDQVMMMMMMMMIVGSVREREAVSEKIIKNYKKINIFIE